MAVAKLRRGTKCTEGPAATRSAGGANRRRFQSHSDVEQRDRPSARSLETDRIHVHLRSQRRDKEARESSSVNPRFASITGRNSCRGKLKRTQRLADEACVGENVQRDQELRDEPGDRKSKYRRSKTTE